MPGWRTRVGDIWIPRQVFFLHIGNPCLQHQIPLLYLILSILSLNMADHNSFLLGLLVLVLAHLTAAESSDDEDGSSPYIDEIKCYGLPYGAWGFASHLITFYTITMQCKKRRPLLPPGGELGSGGAWNLSLVIMKLLMTIIPCIYTMVHCNHDWYVLSDPPGSSNPLGGVGFGTDGAIEIHLQTIPSPFQG